MEPPPPIQDGNDNKEISVLIITATLSQHQTQLNETDIITGPILQMRKLRHREVKVLV
jgi:hypothetical protein